MEQRDINGAQRAQRSARLQIAPRAEQRLHCGAECCQLKRFLHELQSTEQPTFGRDLRRNRSPDYQRARRRVRLAESLQAISNAGPGWIDVEYEQLRI